MTWTHDELAADLLDYRHRVGEIAMERVKVFNAQVDVLAMKLSWTAPKITAYEVKISRADFLADVRAGKWRKYMVIAERLYFAVPCGLVDPRELPLKVGLIIRGEKGWYVRKAAKMNRLHYSERWPALQALLFRHYGIGWDGPARMRAQVERKLGTSLTATQLHQREGL